MREITFKSATLERAVKISSCTPSAKNWFSLLSLKFSKGRTAMLFSDIGFAKDLLAGAAVFFVSLSRNRETTEMRIRATIPRAISEKIRVVRTHDGFVLG